MKKKIRVAVLFGGKSTEHEVSCVSAYSIIRNLDKEKYEPVMIGITKDGNWFHFTGSLEKVKDGSWKNEIGREMIAGWQGRKVSSLSEGVRAMEECDVVLPVLHGLNGEDGTVQGLLELMDIPYVGCGIFASSAGMDKSMGKILFSNAGIPQADYILAFRDDILEGKKDYVKLVSDKFSYPVFVKPSDSGSSVGVTKVKSPDDLMPALMKAQRFDRKVLIEEFIDGREVECAVLGNTDAIAAEPGEIKPSQEFYDYDDKYKLGTSYCVIPAEIPEEARKKIKEYALKAFAAIDGSGLSRVDFFYRKDGSVVLNEINTLPGFTEISMYSKLWIKAGMTYSQLLDRLIELAFARKEETERCLTV